MFKINRISVAICTCVVGIMPIITHAHTSDAVGPGDSNSKWVVGVNAGRMSNPFSDEKNLGFVVPNVEYRGEKLFLKEGALGYNLYRQEQLSAGILLTGNGSFLADHDDYDDNPKLRGLKERDATLDAGFYVQHTTPMGRLKFTVLDGLTGEHGGQSADVNYMFDFSVDKLSINPVVGANWMSADEVDHFFGVSEAEATSDRAAYRGKNSANLYAGVRGRYEISPQWDVSMGATYIRLGSGIADSSIIDENKVVVASVGGNYNF